MLDYLIPAIVFCGYILGYFIKKYVPEEQKQAQPYLYWGKKAMLLLLVISLLFLSQWYWYSFFFLFIGFILGFLVQEVYLYFSLSLFSLELLPAVCIFLYGLLAGEKKKILRNALFFAFPFLLLLFSFNLSFLKMIAAGALIKELFKKKVL